MIAQQLATTGSPLYLHRLVQIEVEKACTSITQHALHQLQGISL